MADQPFNLLDTLGLQYMQMLEKAQNPEETPETPETPAFAFDQDMIQQALRGREAAAQLPGLQNRLNVLQEQAGAGMPQGLQAPGVYQSASPLAFLGQLLSQHGAQKKQAEMQEQIAALLGQQAGGQDAEFQLDLAAKEARLNKQSATGRSPEAELLRLGTDLAKLGLSSERLEEIKRQNRATESNRVIKNNLAKMRLEEKRLKREAQARGIKKAGMWINRNGDIAYIGQRGDGQMVDMRRPDGQGSYEQANLNEYVPLGDRKVFDKLGHLGAKEKSEAMLAVEGVKTLQKASDIAKRFTEEEKALLNDPLLDTLTEYTPAGFRTWVRSQGRDIGRYPNIAKFMLQLDKYASIERHDLYGAALTGTEAANYEAISVAAKGLDFLQRMDRINSVGEMLNESMDRYMGLRGRDDQLVTPYNPYKTPKGIRREKTTSGRDQQAKDMINQGVEQVIDTVQDSDKQKKLQRLMELRRKKAEGGG